MYKMSMWTHKPNFMVLENQLTNDVFEVITPRGIGEGYTIRVNVKRVGHQETVHTFAKPYMKKMDVGEVIGWVEESYYFDEEVVH